jgi:hypothetical protein
MTIGWLHLSDVHECKKEGYHRAAMYDAIVTEVKDNPRKPDIVFFTGDLAFSGTEDEYNLLKDRLLTPLRSVLPAGCPLFTIPGNHDVDRKRVVNPRLWMADEDERTAFQKVDGDGRQKRSDALLPRFEAYRALEREFSAWGEDWLASEQGSVSKIVKLEGRTIAVVGINTAWLCQNDEDWGRLTAGRTMVDAALRQAGAAQPDLLVVLGHHPLAAMTGEKAWSDGDRIRLRLEQANAVYLHGHLHASGGQRTGDSMQSVLAIQAPSGFQAADSTVRRNGLLWGAADLHAGNVTITPKRWNDNFQKYVFDSDAVDPRFRVASQDSFVFPLPGRAIVAPAASPMNIIERVPPLAAEGWEVIDAEILAQKTAKRPSAKEMSDWFDGQFPRWEVALAQGVRPRRTVEDIARRFEAAHDGAPLPLAVLLTGAGGEGKSAALLQVVAKLVQGRQDWTCLWRSAAAAALPDDLFAKLEHRSAHAWIVAIDDAENVGQSLPKALLRIQPRTDVHLVLAARDADWSIRNSTDAIWRGTAALSRVTLAGLDADDARRIAEGWIAYGDEAMGRLSGRTAEQVAHTLLGHAQEQAARREEGALLGALLIAREGEDLKGRVTRLMEPWAEAPGIGDRSLLDIYAMIAAMHAENQLYLSHAVLAFALGSADGELDLGPLRVLRREAMVDGGTTYVLTRHRRIAETARDWLVETGYDVDRWYSFLARAALKEFKERHSGNPDISNWQFDLVQNFVGQGPRRWTVAVAIAKALFEGEPTEPRRLNTYAGTLRRTGQASAALLLFRQEGPRFKERRDVLCEWSVAAGESGDYGLNCWLAGCSLADGQGQALDAKRCSFSLAGLGAAFAELSQRTKRATFVNAQAACGRLGLRLPELEPVGRHYFEIHSEAALPPASKRPVETDLEMLRAAVVGASYETDPVNDPPFFEKLVGDPETYRFTLLRSFFPGNAAVEPNGGSPKSPRRPSSAR